MNYRAPVADLLFALDAAGLPAAAEAGVADADGQTAAAVLEAAGRFAQDVLAPLDRVGDVEGARFEDGRVRCAPGFADAYRAYAEAGWSGLVAPPAHGGQGLPRAVGLAAFEMVHAANMAFGLCPMLSEAAVHALVEHGTARQQALYLPPLVSGEWTGAMNLTEPDAGSDLARVRARAEPEAGGFRLTGQKIFITWGDHDAAENIVHLVLARLPDAPEGVKGISLFLAPKRLVNVDGSLGDANALRPAGIEHKLGIHASPTCTMLFEGARAEMVGRPNQGLACMFTMMNAARLNVGAEGVGVAERAYQGALDYARERRQGRSTWSAAADASLFDLPDVRRMLMLMRARIVAGRGICLETATASDIARAGGADAAVRARGRRREEWLTPVAKSWCTDMGVEVASLAIQVAGGMGYMEETGLAQHYRDARIAPIYEGANGVQAIDLAGRKLGLDDGAAFQEWRADVQAVADACTGDLDLLGDALRQALTACAGAGEWLAQRRGSPDALAGATAFLRLVGDVAGGAVHARRAQLARTSVEHAGRAAEAVALARFYAAQVLAAAPGLAVSATAGAGPLGAWAP